MALAWVPVQGEDIIPVPGIKKRKYVEENAAAVDVSLTPHEPENIENLVAKYPAIGTTRLHFHQAALAQSTISPTS